ncbi:hypothetical protein WH47_02324 [Habropoda laboriosa]|uniref:Uncharacterized protein n=1 Tax=Habropoda laboriosa TaxID=597456 RepID=A0A0L7QZH7_9HYME|nr:hypothetical protein WH47_02324 [Habropoda laboriosa]
MLHRVPEKRTHNQQGLLASQGRKHELCHQCVLIRKLQQPQSKLSYDERGARCTNLVGGQSLQFHV